MKKVFIGVDLHKHQITVCFLSTDGKERIEVYYFSDKGIESFIEQLKLLKECGYELELAVETTGNSEYFYNQVKVYVDKVIVLNTLKLKPIMKSYKKTDKNDCRIIAFFLSKDMLEGYSVNMPSEEAKALRRLLKARHILMRARIGIKNQIHGILLGNGEETKKRFLTSKKGRDNLRKMNYPEQGILNMLIDNIDNLDKQIAGIENEIEQKVKCRSREDEIIQSLPGFGKIISASIIAGIDNIDRFEDPKSLTAYVGLVPYVNNSGDEVRHGRITKTGPAYMRTALVQAVLAMLRSKEMKDHPLVVNYYKMKETKCSGKAIIATARKLLSIIWFLLKRNETFDINYYFNSKVKIEETIASNI
jgi:transposase